MHNIQWNTIQVCFLSENLKGCSYLSVVISVMFMVGSDNSKACVFTLCSTYGKNNKQTNKQGVLRHIFEKYFWVNWVRQT